MSRWAGLLSRVRGIALKKRIKVIDHQVHWNFEVCSLLNKLLVRHLTAADILLATSQKSFTAPFLNLATQQIGIESTRLC